MAFWAAPWPGLVLMVILSAPLRPVPSIDPWLLYPRCCRSGASVAGGGPGGSSREGRHPLLWTATLLPWVLESSPDPCPDLEGLDLEPT